MVKELTTLEEVVAAISSPKLTVLDCFAEWCGPCKVLGNILPKLAQSFPQANVFKVNVDNVPLENLKFGSQNLSISVLPTILYCKDGQLVDTVVGTHVQKIEQTIKKHL
jgi:thioredoxin 1